MSTIVSALALAEQMGVTYRQLDYWCRQGYIAASKVDGDEKHGSGNYRVFAGSELAQATWFGRLVRVGFMPSEEVSRVATRLAINGQAQLPFGLRIEVAA